MELENLTELLECLSSVNSTFLNGSLELSDTNGTCGGEEHFIPKERAARAKGKHRDRPHTAYNPHSLRFLYNNQEKKNVFYCLGTHTSFHTSFSYKHRQSILNNSQASKLYEGHVLVYLAAIVENGR